MSYIQNKRSISKGAQKVLSGYVINEIWNTWEKVLAERRRDGLGKNGTISLVKLQKMENNTYQEVTFVNERRGFCMKAGSLVKPINATMAIIRLDDVDVIMTEKEALATFKDVEGFKESLE